MPIRRGRLADIQAQQVEVGRIRLGTSTPKTARSGKEYNEPVKLETFRLTSRSKALVEEAASLYGGDCEPWQPQNGGAQQWQVLTEQRSIAVIVPPEPVSQYYELWFGGRCQRRCDGLRELLQEQPCICGPDPASRKCKPTTRLSLMLAELSGIGVWRLETHGYYAAAELPAVADLLSAAGGNVPARLEMEERSAMVPDPRDPSKEVATRFMVPVLHVQRTPAQLVEILGGQGTAPALPSGPEQPALPAPESALPEASSYDPDQEQMRVWWTLHTRFEGEIAQAQDPGRLAAVGRAIRQAGLPAQFTDSLRVKWQDQEKALKAERVPQPPPPAPGVPSSNGQPVVIESASVDKQAEWMSIQTTAAALNLTVSDLFGRFQARAGKTVQQATGEDLAVFHEDLRREVASR